MCRVAVLLAHSAACPGRFFAPDAAVDRVTLCAEPNAELPCSVKRAEDLSQAPGAILDIFLGHQRRALVQFNLERKTKKSGS